MKKLMLTLVFVAGCGLSLLAQVKKTEKIQQDEVPVSVRLAFEKDFGQAPQDGTWTVSYTMVTEGARTSAKPMWYQFTKGRGAEKIEVRYTPEAKLESSKGLTKVEDASR
ncbi:hypothetical protein [Chryseolinea lacunae]|uniref:Uncharacterized protein n=1 Tax=Chryseolinea lacunae TaxID=2801331 RepID=A0ABS1KZX1_9BACT|nr:hypothetical protein [Chryseolinea lacunae]MBL0745004.1 hypothetical protein [Chryseolinea lacunae]